MFALLVFALCSNIVLDYSYQMFHTDYSEVCRLMLTLATELALVLHYEINLFLSFFLNET